MRKLMLIAGSALIFSAGVAAAGQPDSPGIVDGQAFGQARVDYASTHGIPKQGEMNYASPSPLIASNFRLTFQTHPFGTVHSTSPQDARF